MPRRSNPQTWMNYQELMDYLDYFSENGDFSVKELKWREAMTIKNRFHAWMPLLREAASREIIEGGNFAKRYLDIALTILIRISPSKASPETPACLHIELNPARRGKMVVKRKEEK